MFIHETKSKTNFTNSTGLPDDLPKLPMQLETNDVPERSVLFAMLYLTGIEALLEVEGDIIIKLN